MRHKQRKRWLSVWFSNISLFHHPSHSGFPQPSSHPCCPTSKLVYKPIERIHIFQYRRNMWFNMIEYDWIWLYKIYILYIYIYIFTLDLPIFNRIFTHSFCPFFSHIFSPHFMAWRTTYSYTHQPAASRWPPRPVSLFWWPPLDCCSRGSPWPPPGRSSCCWSGPRCTTPPSRPKAEKAMWVCLKIGYIPNEIAI